MILVIGGAGYIGSHAVRMLLDKGHEVVVLDDLSTGHEKAVDRRAVFVRGDFGDRDVLRSLFGRFSVCGVMHFAARTLVGESVFKPAVYYRNNTASTLTLLEEMIHHGVKHLIFSSTCAVYGIPEADLITEDLPKRPINPYGASKRMVERMLEDISRTCELRYVALRYFNAAGAHESGEIGEDHDPESHLIPIIMQHLLGKRDRVTVFGTDYPTPDGTCIRDYIHVSDLVEAHLFALEALFDNRLQRDAFNLGTGRGHSVLEVIRKCEEVSGLTATVEYGERRAGDSPKLVASPERIMKTLGWNPKHDLASIIESAWRWHRTHPEGYGTKQKRDGHGAP